MSLPSLIKAVLSGIGAVILAAAALFRLRRRSVPPKPEPHPGGESPDSSSGKKVDWAPIVAIVALIGTLASVIVGHINLREQLTSDRILRATEQAEEGIQREDEQGEERSRREIERLDGLYTHAIGQLASGTPEL